MVDQAQVIASLDRALIQARRALKTAMDRYDLAAVREHSERIDELLDQRCALTPRDDT